MLAAIQFDHEPSQVPSRMAASRKVPSKRLRTIVERKDVSTGIGLRIGLVASRDPAGSVAATAGLKGPPRVPDEQFYEIL